ncbi:MAG: hypothetical protein IJW81_00775 [Clostridia bacterium]|nr:hypothetical protein [Clostridia bacterium]
MKKLTSVLLAFLLLSSFALMTGCAESAGEEVSASPEVSAELPEETLLEEEKEITAADIVNERYANTDLGGYEYKVLAPATGEHFYSNIASGINEIHSPELTGEVLNDAIYTRNLQAEETLNITIVPVWSNGDTSGITTQLHNEVLAGTTGYDTVLNRMDFLGASMQNGDLLNIKNIASIDTSDLWWDKNIVDNFTLFGSKLYFISGDINIFDDFAVEVIYFNKRLCDDNGLAYPYSYVLEGTWTIDKFFEMAKTVELDKNGDGKLDVANDVVGHTEQNDHIKHWIYALGEKSIAINEDGSMEVMLQTERQINVIDKLYQVMVEGAMTYTATPDNYLTGCSLFHGDMLGAINKFRDMEDPFGVIPMPKYDEQQETYGEYVSNGWTTAYGIPMTNQNAEQTGIILDALCGYSTDTLRVALYDVLFSAKLVRDTESVEMLDIIFASKSYDWAVDFSWGGNFASAYNAVYNNKTNNFVSDAARIQKPIVKVLDRLIAKIQELEY